jgi:hypothetical protein
MGMAYDGSGHIFIADSNNHVVRKISVDSWLTFTVAGSGVPGYADSNLATQGRLWYPSNVVVDYLGNLYISSGSAIKKVSNGVMSTLAGGPISGNTDGPGGQARFGQPRGISLDRTGHLYVADRDNNSIRSIDLQSGEVSTVAGGEYGTSDGIGKAAKFYHPYSLAFDGFTNLYIAEYYGGIRCLNVSTGAVRTLLSIPDWSHGPSDIAFAGNKLYVTGGYRNAAYSVDLSLVKAQKIAGLGSNWWIDDSSGNLSSPFGLLFIPVGPLGTIYISEAGSGKIRLLN